MEFKSSGVIIGWAAAGFVLVGIPLLCKGFLVLIALIERATLSFRENRALRDVRENGIVRRRPARE